MTAMVAKRTAQLELPITPAAAVAPWHAPADREELARLRAQLPATVQFGTCGFVYPGWEGLVWSGPRSEADLERDGLREYATHPLLTTVFLTPVAEVEAAARELVRYAAQLPAGVHCILQVDPLLTTPRFTHASHAGAARGPPGQVNPRFLDSRSFAHEILPTYRQAFGERLGPFLLTFPPTLARAGISPTAFAERLEGFLAAQDPSVAFAVELREPEFLTVGYARLLALYGVSHAFTTWSGMPSLLEQARAVPTSPEVVIQVVDPTGKGESRRARLAPFAAIGAADARLRQEVVALATANLGIPTYVLVHNEAEGCAPLTVLALARMLVAAGADRR